MFKYVAVLFLVIGCTSAPKGWQDTPDARFKEPTRSQFYTMCLMAGSPVTHCSCVESNIIAKFGSPEEALKADPGALESSARACYNLLKDAIQKELDAAQEEAIEASPQARN